MWSLLYLPSSHTHHLDLLLCYEPFQEYCSGGGVDTNLKWPMGVGQLEGEIVTSMVKPYITLLAIEGRCRRVIMCPLPAKGRNYTRSAVMLYNIVGHICL